MDNRPTREALAVECVRLAEQIRGKKIDRSKITTDDPRARDMFRDETGKISRASFDCAWLMMRYPDCFFTAVMNLVKD